MFDHCEQVMLFSSIDAHAHPWAIPNLQFPVTPLHASVSLKGIGPSMKVTNFTKLNF